MAPQLPTPAILVRFEAKPDASGVTIEWETAAEPGVFGFQVERALEGGAFAALSTFIFPEGTAVSGAIYSFRDTTLRAGQVASYRLIEFGDGGRIAHDAVTVSLLADSNRLYLPILLRGTSP